MDNLDNTEKRRNMSVWYSACLGIPLGAIAALILIIYKGDLAWSAGVIVPFLRAIISGAMFGGIAGVCFGIALDAIVWPFVDAFVDTVNGDYLLAIITVGACGGLLCAGMGHHFGPRLLGWSQDRSTLIAGLLWFYCSMRFIAHDQMAEQNIMYFAGWQIFRRKAEPNQPNTTSLPS